MSTAEMLPLDAQSRFLSLQKNSIQFQTKLDRILPGEQRRPWVYKKPGMICESVGDTIVDIWKSKFQFARKWRKTIEKNVRAHGLDIKKMEGKDTDAIMEFLVNRYKNHGNQSLEIQPFDLYRWREYGHGLVLMDEENKVQGTIFEVGYDTPEHTSYTIRLAVSDAFGGRGLGENLMTYSALLAMEKGSMVKRGIISMDNLRSLYINLNKVGWIIDAIEPDIHGLGSFYKIALPLDPHGLTGNRVNRDKLIRFIETHKEQLDYILVKPDDLSMIKCIYQYSDFRIAAFVKSGWIDQNPYLVAMPKTSLQYQPAT